MDDVLQKNAVGSERMASMSETLANQAEDLQSAIRFFRLSNTDLA
jgi:methyl-accepting chemotaxis protein